jgi:hypothetical protein
VVGLGYSFRGSLPRWFEEEWVVIESVEGGKVRGRLDEEIRRGGHAPLDEDVFGSRLVERQADCERIASEIRDIEEFCYGGNVSFAIRAVETFGHVE